MNEFFLVDVFLGTFTGDLLRYVLGAGGVYLIVNVALATRLHHKKIREKKPASKQLLWEILASLRTVIIFTLIGTSIVFGATAGVLQIYTDVADYGWVYFTGSAMLIVLLHDAYFYWSHRLLHIPRIFKWVHKLHHKSYNPSPFTSYSFDTSEAIVHAIFLPLILVIIPLHPVVLFFFTMHMMLRNAIGHCGYEIFPATKAGKPLWDWMTTVTHHDLHHAHAGYNLGLYFTWWDRWMGTEHPKYASEFARASGQLQGQ
jgi:sterol desaturase/sphingolipid hydroxylase (fatty acid hydroxylase superfamily)